MQRSEYEKQKYETLYDIRPSYSSFEHSHRKDQFLSLENDFYSRLYSRLEKSHYPLTIFDIGCGKGTFGSAIRSINPIHLIFGIDISEKAIKVARLRGAYLDLFVEDFTSYNPPSLLVYDVILFFDGLEHYHSDVEDTVIYNTLSLSKVGGEVYFTISTTSDDTHDTELVHKGFLDGAHVNVKTSVEWETSIRSVMDRMDREDHRRFEFVLEETNDENIVFYVVVKRVM